ncbi:MAG: arsenate reductase [Euzebyales bacterium]|nr:arsenate reductase [Euzebyales bacterium]
MGERKGSEMDIQLLGLPKSKTTRKAQRFFTDRRIAFHDLDLRRHKLSPGELSKWVQRFGVEACLDPASKSYREQALQYVSAGEDAWLGRMGDDPSILALPLVRCGKELAVGDDPDGWRRIADAARGGDRA